MNLEINIDTDKVCPRCNKKGTTQNGLCLDCNVDIVKWQPFLKPKKSQGKPDASSRIEIRKIKSKNKRIQIEYDLYRGKSEDADHYALDCQEEAKESFYKVLAALAPHVAAICEIPGPSELITVSGVSFSWTDGVMGATITGLRLLRNSSAPLVLNTPHKPEAPYSEGADESNILPEDTRTALYELMAEAEAYICGERKYKQMEMFPEKEDAA
jgi:hypothetical protein